MPYNQAIKNENMLCAYIMEWYLLYILNQSNSQVKKRYDTILFL